MPAFVAPQPGETRKAWLHRAYGIGKGSGRGRISAEGHVKISEAVAKGHTFADTEAVSAPKVSRPKAAPAAEPKVTIPEDRRDEARAIDPGHIREWARANGISVSARGRISADTTLRFLNEVPAHEREARMNNGKDLRAEAPRIHPVGTTWRGDFQYKGERHTVTLSDRTACGRCRYSLGWCGCERPHVTVGYEDGPVRLTVIPPKGVEA